MTCSQKCSFQSSFLYELVPVTAKVFTETPLLTFIFMQHILGREYVKLYCVFGLSRHTYCSTDVQQNFRMFEESKRHHTKSQNYPWCMWTRLWHAVLDTPIHLSTFQHHGTPQVFRFYKKWEKWGGNGVLSSCSWPGERKEWLPKEEPFFIMKDMPPGYPSLLRPGNTKNAMPNTMERALDNLKSRLTGADT